MIPINLKTLLGSAALTLLLTFSAHVMPAQAADPQAKAVGTPQRHSATERDFIGVSSAASDERSPLVASHMRAVDGPAVAQPFHPIFPPLPNLDLSEQILATLTLHQFNITQQNFSERLLLNEGAIKALDTTQKALDITQKELKSLLEQNRLQLQLLVSDRRKLQTYIAALSDYAARRANQDRQAAAAAQKPFSEMEDDDLRIAAQAAKDSYDRILVEQEQRRQRDNNLEERLRSITVEEIEGKERPRTPFFTLQ